MNAEPIGLGRRVGHVSHLYRRNIDNVIGEESRNYTDSMTGRNFWVLRYLQDHAGEAVYQKDLETEFKIRRSTVSCMVELMEQKGFLRRESVGGDARLKRLVLTPRAETLLNAVFAGVQRMETEVQAAFTPEEYQTLTVLLERLAAVLENRELQQMKGTESNPL